MSLTKFFKAIELQLANIVDGWLTWNCKLLLRLTNTMMNWQDSLERHICSDGPTALDTTNKTAADDNDEKEYKLPFTCKAFPGDRELFKSLKTYIEHADLRRVSDSPMYISLGLLKELISQSVIGTHELDNTISIFADVGDLGVFLKKVYNQSEVLTIGACCRSWERDVRLPRILIFELSSDVHFFTEGDFQSFFKGAPKQ